jgi:epoxide hydrolase-like predicted phosphatase
MSEYLALSYPPRAVLFDLGGVVLGSPFPAIARFEKQRGIAPGTVVRAIANGGEHGAFQRLERGELDVRTFASLFKIECAAPGPEIDGVGLIAAIGAAMKPRPAYLETIRRIRARGLLAAALTNNWKDEPSMDGVSLYFDIFLESCKLGMRKPDPRIYRHACERLTVSPCEVIYLDDIGSNLKPARELGMHTILVTDPDQALLDLQAALGFDLK